MTRAQRRAWQKDARQRAIQRANSVRLSQHHHHATSIQEDNMFDPLNPAPDLFNEWLNRKDNREGNPTAQRVSQPRQDDDNVPGFYYFDMNRCLSFHWTGIYDHQVEVSHGGDHEYPTWFFVFPEYAPSKPSEMTSTFKSECDEWIARMEGKA